MPMFDGPPKFDMRVAMVTVGANQGKTASLWQTKLTVIEVAGYLAFLQTSKLGVGAARRAWVMQWKLSRVIHVLPYTHEGDIDWAKLKFQIEQEISDEFPLCA